MNNFIRNFEKNNKKILDKFSKINFWAYKVIVRIFCRNLVKKLKFKKFDETEKKSREILI